MRDPRINPTPGDVVVSSGTNWGLRCFVRVHEVRNGKVYYERGWRERLELLQDGDTDLCFMDIDSWKKACAELGAAVEEIADERPSEHC
jgi:hypothetical protein